MYFDQNFRVQISTRPIFKVCSRDADVLVTADSEGYIRAWNIENYCIHSVGPKNRRRQRAGALPKINITEDVVLSDKRNRQINNIPPDQIFQLGSKIFSKKKRFSIFFSSLDVLQHKINFPKY